MDHVYSYSTQEDQPASAASQFSAQVTTGILPDQEPNFGSPAGRSAVAGRGASYFAAPDSTLPAAAENASPNSSFSSAEVKRSPRPSRSGPVSSLEQGSNQEVQHDEAQEELEASTRGFSGREEDLSNDEERYPIPGADDSSYDAFDSGAPPPDEDRSGGSESLIEWLRQELAKQGRGVLVESRRAEFYRETYHKTLGDLIETTAELDWHKKFSSKEKAIEELLHSPDFKKWYSKEVGEKNLRRDTATYFVNHVTNEYFTPANMHNS
ncbi:hypothetical protein FRC01_014656 [Tulasnella sp. 417]|nr:hypothetical protein FRC01_014656 [Tulasnella sp. 417]